MDELITYYATQKEKLTLAIQDGIVANPIETKIKHKNIASTDEEAKTRVLSSLVHEVEKKCEEYLNITHNPIQNDISFIFGTDNNTNILHKIYENVCAIEMNQKDTNSKVKTYSLSSHVANVNFQELCPRCSGKVARYNSGIMKKYMTYERCVLSKKSCLSFTTRHKGTCVQIILTLPCASCTKNNEESLQKIHLKTIPSIEEEYIEIESLHENPINFIEDCIWRWIDDYR